MIAYRVWVPVWKPPCHSHCESTSTCACWGSGIWVSVDLSNSSWRTTSRLDLSSVSSCHTRTAHPLVSGFLLLLLSRCSPQRHSRIVLGLMRSSCTLPNRAPTDSSHLMIVGHFSAFGVHSRSRSHLSKLPKAPSSISPVADVMGDRKSTRLNSS